jgi:hypothetical protein
MIFPLCNSEELVEIEIPKLPIYAGSVAVESDVKSRSEI